MPARQTSAKDEAWALPGVCPKCGSPRIRRSRSRDFREKFLKSVGYRPFRCREQGCDWRELVRVKSIREIRSEFLKKYGMKLFVVLTSVAVMLYFLWFSLDYLLDLKKILFLW